MVSLGVPVFGVAATTLAAPKRHSVDTFCPKMRIPSTVAGVLQPGGRAPISSAGTSVLACMLLWWTPGSPIAFNIYRQNNRRGQTRNGSGCFVTLGQLELMDYILQAGQLVYLKEDIRKLSDLNKLITPTRISLPIYSGIGMLPKRLAYM